jgi:hypothetical protein
MQYLLRQIAKLGCASGLIAIGLSLGAAPAGAATITVTTENDFFGIGPSGCSLRRAINAANNNSDFNGCVGIGPYGDDTIVFAPGVVTVTLTLNTGGGDNDSNGYRDLDVGGPLAGALTIQGPAQGVAIVAAPSIGDRVFDILPTGSAPVTLTNLTILGGLTPATSYETGASGDPCYQGGGGIRHRGGALALNNVWVRGNTARLGAGVCHQGQGLVINNSVLISNTTQGGDGGGLYSKGGSAVIADARVLSNTAVISEAGARGGGGIFHAPGSGGMTIVSSRIAGNLARRIVGSDEAHGGGIASRADLTLTQSTVSDNTVHNLSGPQSLGGGILHVYGSFVAGQSVIAGNVATATFGLGGGLYTGGSAAEINGGQILSNTAREGGGWRNTVNDALLIGSEVRFNLATQNGGGIYNSLGSNVGVLNAIVCDNRAAGMGSTAGGGILNLGGSASLYLQDSVVCRNQASAGGGVYNNSAGMVIQGSYVFSNAATASSGGGVYNSAAMVIQGSYVFSNAATASSGGGIYHNGPSLRIEASAVTSNAASAYGAGLMAFNAPFFSALNSTFSGNQSVAGSVYAQISTGYLTYTTIASNTGVGLHIANGGLVSLRATLLAGNGSGNCLVSSGGALTSNNDNLSSDATCAGSLTASNDLTNTNPLLRPLALNGAPLAPSHAPLPHSPALNRIPPARCVADDQRNAVRPQNGRCDVGAVELRVWPVYAPIVQR